MPVLGKRSATFPHAEDGLRARGIHLKQHPHMHKGELQRCFIKRLQQFGRKVTFAPLFRAYIPLVFLL